MVSEECNGYQRSSTRARGPTAAKSNIRREIIEHRQCAESPFRHFVISCKDAVVEVVAAEVIL